VVEVLSKRGALLLSAVRRNFDLLKEHEKVSIAEVNFIVDAIASHIRSWKPLAFEMPTAPENPDGR
jgi:hypothetical protein